MNTQIAIVIITAILAPVLTRIADMFVSYRQKRFEIMYADKVQRYTALSAAYGDLYESAEDDRIREFVSLAWSSILVCDKTSRSLLLDFLDRFEKNKDATSPELDKLFTGCLESLSDDIKKSGQLINIRNS